MLKELEGVAPSKEDYSQLCLLLTLNKLSEHSDYRIWNPVKARCNIYKYKYKYKHNYKYKYQVQLLQADTSSGAGASGG